MSKVSEFGDLQLKKDIVEFRAGDTLEVDVRIREGEKERTQKFEGIVMQIRGEGLNNTFTGVQMRTLIELAQPTPEAKFVLQHAASEPSGDFTVNVPLDEFTQDDCVLTYLHDGESLAPEHGYPVRAVVPRLYFWKGAKWITGIELRATDAPGFWEINGYHMHGNPWMEERFGW